MSIYEAAGVKPRVTLKRLHNRGHSWEVSVPATGASVQELRLAAETAETISAELEEKFGTSREAKIAAANEIPF